jgi:hypothetical protein
MKAHLQKHYDTLIDEIVKLEPNLFLTFNFNMQNVSDQYAFDSVRNFDAKISKLMLGRKWIEMPEKRIPFWLAAEHIDGNYHFHVAAHLDEQQKDFCRLVPGSDKKGKKNYTSVLMQLWWQEFVPAGELDLRPVDSPIKAAKYMLKSYEAVNRLEAFDRVVNSNLLRAVKFEPDKTKSSVSAYARKPKFQVVNCRPEDDRQISDWLETHKVTRIIELPQKVSPNKFAERQVTL